MRLLALLGTVISVGLVGSISVIKVPIKLIYNPSLSAPVGFYWVENSPPIVGDYVAVWAPDRVKNLVERNKILPLNIPLIKRVRGVMGDEICRIGLRILINNVEVSVALESDNLGRAMPDWQGCVVLSEENIFLLQGHPHSFDGRYFGPIDRSVIIGKAIKLPVF